MDKTEVLKLAKLARIELEDSHAEKLSHEFEAILGYVAEVKNVVGPATHEASQNRNEFALRNVMRGDESMHESGIHTEAILDNAPNSKDGYIVVKKIL